MILGRRSRAAHDRLVNAILTSTEMLMPEPRYVPVELPSAEAPRIAPDPNRGEKVDPKTGAIVAHLPADLKPCPATWEDEASHPSECACRGTGMVPIRRPAGEGVDPADDSLDALVDAFAEEQENGVDAYLGDTVANLMHRDVDVKGGGGGRGPKKPRGGGQAIIAVDPTSTIDGRLERTGRPPRFGETRKARVRTTIAPETANIMVAQKDDLARLADELLSDPEVRAVLAEVKGEQRADEPGKGAA